VISEPERVPNWLGADRFHHEMNSQLGPDPTMEAGISSLATNAWQVGRMDRAKETRRSQRDGLEKVPMCDDSPRFQGEISAEEPWKSEKRAKNQDPDYRRV